MRGTGAPIIVRRRKTGSEERHHGGALKVAMIEPCELARFAPGFRDAAPGAHAPLAGMAGSF
jgi:hypothetical protein